MPQPIKSGCRHFAADSADRLERFGRAVALFKCDSPVGYSPTPGSDKLVAVHQRSNGLAAAFNQVIALLDIRRALEARGAGGVLGEAR